ncbi:MAG: lipopolysaccharide biosynthesis protein [Flavobacteriaceae bacterium]
MNSQNNKFLVESLKTLFTRIIGFIAIFYSTAILTRTVSLAFLGLFSMVSSMIEIAVLFAHFGVGPLILKKIGGTNDRTVVKNLYLTEFCGYWAKSILLTIFIMLMSYPVIGSTSYESYYIEFLIMIASAVFTAVYVFHNYFLNAIGRVWQSTLSRNTLASVIFALTLLVYHSYVEITLSTFNIALIFIFSRLIAALTSQMYTNSLIGISFTHIVNNRKIQMEATGQEQKWFFYSQVLDSLSNSGIFFTLSLLTTATNIGLITIILKIALPAQVIYTVLQKQAINQISRHIRLNDSRSLLSLFLKISFLGGIIAILYIIGIAFFLDELLFFFGLTENMISYTQVGLILFGYAIASVTSIAGPILQMSGMEKKKMIFGTLSLALQVIVIVIMGFFEFGITGICIGLMMGLVLKSSLEFVSAWKVMRG